MMTVRLSDNGWAQIEKLAREHGVSKATVMRVMCSVALEAPKALSARLKQVSDESGL
jgi:DNA-binding LacI/PurR family transcriptional regulator